MLEKLNIWNSKFGFAAVRRPFSFGKIRESQEKLRTHSNSELRAATESCREMGAAKTNRLEPEFVVALVLEAIRRTQGFNLHPVQIQGVWATAKGSVIEMQTGEGKTVVTGAAALLKVLFGDRVHVATTNDYLAERDYQTMLPAFDLLGVSSGLLPGEMEKSKSRLAYDRDITYGPGYQFGFDFLFDQITLRQHTPTALGRSFRQSLVGFEIAQELVQCRGLQTCIVDEVDSVLVDEATTPLILSFESDREISNLPYELAKSFSRSLQRDVDFELDISQKSITLTSSGEEKLMSFRRAKSLKLERHWKGYVRAALFADHFLILNEDYVVQNGEVNIVDEYTGRIFDDRSWQSGLHQAVECKEGLAVNPPRVSKARITRQRFMGFYESVCGLSGTALDAKRDFREFYSIKVVPIKTHLPCQRKVLPPRFFVDQDAKLKAIADDAKQRQTQGQPVLIGTRTIKESIRVQSIFEEAGLSTVLLNGLQDKEEAKIVAEAGQSGAITIATNMAGRGTDIKLSESAKTVGGLHVIGTSPNQSFRIDRQLMGRSARQGQQGSAQFFVSADDELINRFSKRISRQIRSSANSGGESQGCRAGDIRELQNRLDLQGFQKRREMVMQDCWMDQVRDCIFAETTDE